MIARAVSLHVVTTGTDIATGLLLAAAFLAVFFYILWRYC